VVAGDIQQRVILAGFHELHLPDDIDIGRGQHQGIRQQDSGWQVRQ
jgi:hypothetical protein